MKNATRIALVTVVALAATALWAGQIDSPAPPGDPASYMPSFADVCARLDSGATPGVPPGTFVEPTGPPADTTICNLADVLAKAPAPNALLGASTADVLAGRSYWSLRPDGSWGTRNGAMPIQVPNPSTVSQPSGFYPAYDLSVVDPDLTSGNVRGGTTVFGVAGDPDVVDTASGDAVADDIIAGKKAWVDGVEVTGSLVAASLPDGPCFDVDNRYIDCGNGTVTDTVTSLIWLKDADCLGLLNYPNAGDAVVALADGQCGLTDNSRPGDWRIPTRDEWVETVTQALAWGCTGVVLTDTSGFTCWSQGDPFDDVKMFPYWTTTAIDFDPDLAYGMALNDGGFLGWFKGFALWTWPVRDF